MSQMAVSYREHRATERPRWLFARQAVEIPQPQFRRLVRAVGVSGVRLEILCERVYRARRGYNIVRSLGVHES